MIFLDLKPFSSISVKTKENTDIEQQYKILVQPPKTTQPLKVLHPALEIKFPKATLDPENVAVFASLYKQDGTEATVLLEGTMRGAYSNGNSKFSNLKISTGGEYKIRFTAWCGYTRLGTVDSTIISVKGELELKI